MRLLAKTTSYGALHVVIATSVAYALTGNMAVALGIGLIEPLVQTIVFPLHEMVWERKTNKPTKSYRIKVQHSY
jgi:uncharacterized membrane protein